MFNSYAPFLVIHLNEMELRKDCYDLLSLNMLIISGRSDNNHKMFGVANNLVLSLNLALLLPNSCV